jgi:hypothetical protein
MPVRMERATSGRSPATGNQVTRPARGEHQARGPESPETCSANRGVLPLRREGAGRRPAGRSGASRPGIEPGGCTSASTSICEDVAMLSRGGAPSGASSAVKIRPLRNLTVDSRTPAAGARPNRSTPWEDFPLDGDPESRLPGQVSCDASLSELVRTGRFHRRISHWETRRCWCAPSRRTVDGLGNLCSLIRRGRRLRRHGRNLSSRVRRVRSALKMGFFLKSPGVKHERLRAPRSVRGELRRGRGKLLPRVAAAPVDQLLHGLGASGRAAGSAEACGDAVCAFTFGHRCSDLGS